MESERFNVKIIVDIGNGERVFFETNHTVSYLDIPYIDVDFGTARKVSFLVVPLTDELSYGICIQSDLVKFETLKQIIWQRMNLMEGEI